MLLKEKIKNILVTGGAGYIGSHAALKLIENGYNVIVVDNLSNSSKKSIDKVSKLVNKKVIFYETDISKIYEMQKIFEMHKFNAVMHFAGLKSVDESIEKPKLYYENNVVGTLKLLECMKRFNVKKIIFSSSATVYGIPKTLPITELMPLEKPVNPYGQTKIDIENLLDNLYAEDSSWSIISLRYFNPIGAHKSGEIGEDPKGVPNNLLPYISQVANGNLAKLKVYGGDYQTKDGTGVRDYIHIMDLVEGHIKSLEFAFKNKGISQKFNLGTGNGYSVLEILETFRKISGKTIPYEIVDKRPGDIAESYADPTKANEILNWKASRNLKQMCEDVWNWQQKNPEGYKN